MAPKKETLEQRIADLDEHRAEKIRLIESLESTRASQRGKGRAHVDKLIESTRRYIATYDEQRATTRAALVGVKHGDAQRDRQAKSVKAKKGFDGKSLKQLITAFVPPLDAETYEEIWHSFRDELSDWSGSDVQDGIRNYAPTYIYKKRKDEKLGELTYKRFFSLLPKSRRLR